MTAKELGDQPAYQFVLGSPHSGLTKREAMAMAAMTGLIAIYPQPNIARLVQESVEHADALLAELAKEKL